MNDLDITMEEYVQLETKWALRNGKVYNWETTTYGKIWYDEDVHYLRVVETEFPTIVYNDALHLNQISHLNLRIFLTGFNMAYPETWIRRIDFLNLTGTLKEFGVLIFWNLLIIEQIVKVNQKERVLELKRRNYKEHYSDILHVVSIKEDTAYLCLTLRSTTTKKIYIPYQEDHTLYRRSSIGIL
nr:hypothetical protein [Tanacetum cinerariifolium]